MHSRNLLIESMETSKMDALATKYGITLKPRRKVAPKPLDLSSEAGQHLFRKALERVMVTHARVIKALAER
jgi:hypothetical protein